MRLNPNINLMVNRTMEINILTTIAICLVTAFTAVNGQSVPEKATDICPLLPGESIPEVEVRNLTGETIALKKIIGSKPTVLIFYRGGWCPYCNLHLAELQGIEKDILKLGYQVVAISPDAPQNLKASLEEYRLNYHLFSDASMKVAQAFGIAFAVPETSKEHLKESSGGENPGQLPVPSVFVLNQEGEILFEYVSPNYKKRLSAGLLLSVLTELQK